MCRECENGSKLALEGREWLSRFKAPGLQLSPRGDRAPQGHCGRLALGAPQASLPAEAPLTSFVRYISLLLFLTSPQRALILAHPSPAVCLPGEGGTGENTETQRRVRYGEGPCNVKWDASPIRKTFRLSSKESEMYVMAERK